jgi:hypothetical protein
VKETLLGVLFIVLSAGVVVVMVGGIRSALKEPKRDDDKAD